MASVKKVNVGGIIIGDGSDVSIQSMLSRRSDDFEGNIVVRSYKLYESIQKEFADFCKANNKYKVQDILCQFIKDGLEKYK